jgi:hypothetical protein
VSEKCTLGLPESLIEPKPIRENKHRKPADYAKQYSAEFAHLHAKDIYKKDLLSFTKAELSKQKLLATVGEGGKVNTFPSLKRGTQFYSRHQSEIYNRYAFNLKEMPGEPLFLTATFDAKLTNGDPVPAWRLFKDALRDFDRLLKRHGFEGRISVTESTKNGFPHAHFVVKKPGVFFQHYTNTRGQDKIRYTKDLTAIKNGFQLGYVDIQPAQNDSVQGYVFKYLQKSQCPEVLARQADVPQQWDSVKKALLGFLFITTNCMRYTRVSRALSAPVKAAEKAEREARESALKDALLEKLKDAKNGNDLIDSINNLAINLCPRTFAVSWNGLPDSIKSSPYQEFKPDDPFVRQFRDSAIQIGCPGCPFRDGFYKSLRE